MNKKATPTTCYIASYKIREFDQYLEINGFYDSMIVFSIPDYGIIYRCRVSGDALQIEFASFFALIQFVRKDLKDENIKAIEVVSSMPEFIFSLTPNSPFMKHESSHKTLLTEISKEVQLTVKYVAKRDNKALVSAADFPSVPEPEKVKISLNQKELKKISFQPFQKGIRF